MDVSFRTALRNAEESLDQGEIQDESFDRLEGVSLNDPQDRADRGKCLARARRYDAAVADLAAAVSSGLKDTESYYVLAVSFSALGMRGRAISALRRAVRLRPGWSGAVYALCWELEMAGQHDQALKELRRYKRRDPGKNREIYRHWGRIRGRQGKWRQAYAAYVKSVWLRQPGQNEPDPVQQKYAEITALRGRASRMDPEKSASFDSLGAGLVVAGWHSEAADVLHTGALMRPNVDTYLTVGALYEQMWRSVDAAEAYREGIRAMKGAVPPVELSKLYEALVTSLFRSSRVQEALKYGEEAMALGAGGPQTQKYCKFVQKNPDRVSDMDPVSAGQTAPWYEAYHLE